MCNDERGRNKGGGLREQSDTRNDAPAGGQDSVAMPGKCRKCGSPLGSVTMDGCCLPCGMTATPDELWAYERETALVADLARRLEDLENVTERHAEYARRIEALEKLHGFMTLLIGKEAAITEQRDKAAYLEQALAEARVILSKSMRTADHDRMMAVALGERDAARAERDEARARVVELEKTVDYFKGGRERARELLKTLCNNCAKKTDCSLVSRSQCAIYLHANGPLDVDLEQQSRAAGRAEVLAALREPDEELVGISWTPQAIADHLERRFAAPAGAGAKCSECVHDLNKTGDWNCAHCHGNPEHPNFKPRAAAAGKEPA